MVDLSNLRDGLLASGRVGEQEVQRICQALYCEARLDRPVVEILATVRREARQVCESFESLFVDAVKLNVLAGGSIDADGAAWLRRLLVAERGIDEGGKRILWQLKREARRVCPEFRRLYEECVG